MKINKIIPIIIEAQKLLVNQPFDLAHDITHHCRVSNNCFEIVRQENLKNVDEDTLSICAWWHDVNNRRGETLENLNSILIKEGFDKKSISLINKVIKEHSYGNNQTTLESKILFDADKLEYVSLARLIIFVNAYKEGFLSKEITKNYFKQWFERVDKIEELLHFKSTRNIFKRSYLDVLPFMREHRI